LLIAALFCAAMLVAVDLDWLHPDNLHEAAWLGLALFFYFAREVRE
jgi:hypothetical protein